MLTKRAQILFENQKWLGLEMTAQARGVSVGQLVREAVAKTYRERPRRSAKVVAALDHIRKIRPVFKGKIDYEELINYKRD